MQAPCGPTLADAVSSLQGLIVGAIPKSVPLVSIGPSPAIEPDGFAVQTTFEGWRGGVVPHGAAGLPEEMEFTPAGVLAGALAVSELFAHFDGDTMAGYRRAGMSLWDQSPAADWASASSDGPSLGRFPSDFWVIGLGHLGQAFLWTIGLLPYTDPKEVRLFLQDVDDAGGSTESTSVLTFGDDKGRLKTRICADWGELRGFRTRLIERRFAPDLRVTNDEPLLALCGVDNPQARAILEGAGFATIFEAGLGAGVEDFRLIRTHSFPAPVRADRIWGNNAAETRTANRAPSPEKIPPAYSELRNRGLVDECGLAQLAEVAVGAPFVGMTAAATLVSQVLRMVADGHRPTVTNLDLRSLQHRSVVEREGADIVIFGTAPSE